MPSRFFSESRAASGGGDVCWDEYKSTDLVLRRPDIASESERCPDRYGDLASAKAACLGSARAWCGGVTRDNGIRCETPRAGQKLHFELRTAESEGETASTSISWVHRPRPKDGSSCAPAGERRGTKRGLHVRRTPSAAAARGFVTGSTHLLPPPRGFVTGSMHLIPPPDARSSDDDRLNALLRANLEIARERMARGPPAFERFPHLAFRNRDWRESTRHGRGDMYPLYTQVYTPGHPPDEGGH